MSKKPEKKGRKEYLKEYNKNNRAKINKYKREWRKKDRAKNLNKTRVYDRKYRNSRKEKQTCMNKVQWAIESGKLVKPSLCECCNSKRKLEGHHRDYNKPLEIMWLCYPCHGYIHRFDEWEKWLPSEAELHEIWYKATGIEISLTINKGLRAISKRIRGEK